MVFRLVVLFIAAGASVSAPAQDMNVRLLASNCANCHGTDGRSQGGMPSISGLPKERIVEELQDFKSGKRPSTIMQQLARGYTDAELNALGEYFAAQKN